LPAFLLHGLLRRNRIFSELYFAPQAARADQSTRFGTFPPFLGAVLNGGICSKRTSIRYALNGHDSDEPIRQRIASKALSLPYIQGVRLTSAESAANNAWRTLVSNYPLILYEIPN
jgi:hypothetical protein